MIRNLLILLVGIALGVGVAEGAQYWSIHKRAQTGSIYQAVLLDNGQVYFGKLDGAGTEFPVLTDVYYIQNKIDPQTKAVSNVLVRRGKEWHSPDRMILNGRHVILIEPVGGGSQVAKLIAELNTTQ
jgi:hypothetical protein